MSSREQNPTNAFPNGFDRWFSLQLTSQRIQKRAAILNSLEELRMNQLCKQIDATFQIENGKREVVGEKLQDSLKENRLYWGALHRIMKELEMENDQSLEPDLLPYGRYHGWCMANMSEQVQKQKEYVKQMRMKQVTELHKKSKKESSVLIDRKLSTNELLAATDKPLSERLQRSRSARLKSVRVKAKAVSRFIDLNDKVRNEKEQKVLENATPVFKTDERDDEY